MSADTAASRARVASTSAAEGAAVLLAATEAVEEVEASRPRTASARRAAMRSAEEAGDVIFFNQVGNEHRASEREKEPGAEKLFPFLGKREQARARLVPFRLLLSRALEARISHLLLRAMRASTCAAAGISGAAR